MTTLSRPHVDSPRRPWTQSAEAARTLVHALHDRAERLTDGPALWSRERSRWRYLSWRELADEVRYVALALLELGLERGERVALVAPVRRETVVTYLAVMAVGGVVVTLDPEDDEAEVTRRIEHSQASTLVVDTPGRLEGLPPLRRRLVLRTTRSLPDDVHTWSRLRERGQGLPDAPYYTRANALSSDAVATCVFPNPVVPGEEASSGLRRSSKGVGTSQTRDPGDAEPLRAVLASHANLLWTARRLLLSEGLEEGEVVIASRSLDRTSSQLLTLVCPVLAGWEVYLCDGVEALTEVRPTVFQGQAEEWAGLEQRVTAELSRLPTARRALHHWARAVTVRRNQRVLIGEHVRKRLALQHRLAAELVLLPLKVGLGLDRCHTCLAFTADAREARVGKGTLDFFSSLGLVIHEVYGPEVATGLAAVNTPLDTRLGTLGQPLVGVALKIEPDGEIQLQGPNVCVGLLGSGGVVTRPSEGGWVRTGDVGELDPEGFLLI